MRIALLIAYGLAGDLEQGISAGEHPRMEVLELAHRLQARIIDGNSPRGSNCGLVKAMERVAKPLAMAALACRQRNEIDVLYVGNDKLGILVAALFKLFKPRPRIVIVNHHLSKSGKALLFGRLHLQDSVDALICLNEYQARFLEEKLVVKPEKIRRVHYGAVVDGSFFRPQPGRPNSGNYILSVGRESRDYATLLRALEDSGVPAKIVASGMQNPEEYPERAELRSLRNVELFDRIPYPELRDLYDGCSFVVIPMHNVDYPAGITTVMEAMAMGKAVIATYSRGIEEFIENSVTGFWTETGNHEQLRKNILCLWNNPSLARQMGQRAYQSVQGRVDMNRYVQELEAVIASVA